MLKPVQDYAMELINACTTRTEFLRAWRDGKFPGVGATYALAVVDEMKEHSPKD